MSEVATQSTPQRYGSLNATRAGYKVTSETGPRYGTSGSKTGVERLSNVENTTSNSQKQSRPGSSRVPLTSIPANRNGNMENSTQHSVRTWADRQAEDNISLQSKESDVPDNMYRPDKEDREGWIHREKLAKIESEELQAAGINLAKIRRSSSKLQAETRSIDESTNPSATGQVEGHPNRVASPIQEEDGGREDWDLRSPEEIAESSSPQPVYANPVLRRPRSKIPILSSSPPSAAVEHADHSEYPSFIPRKRTISNSMTAQDQIRIPRSRPSSRGADAALNIRDAATPSPATRVASKTSSPMKSKVAKPSGIASTAATTPASRKTTPSARKSSLPHKGTPNSTNSPSQRPTTSSGDRPRTAINRPEGDPPWLATMYKPDPMLHPDLQIIPTHARKQQQQQWAETDAVPIVYDKEFTPLAVHVGNGVIKQPSPLPSPHLEKTESEANTWPLKPTTPKPPTITIPRPGSSYSIIPRVSSPKISSQPGTPTMGAFPRDALQVPSQERGQSRSPTRSHQFQTQQGTQQSQIRVTRMPVQDKEEIKKEKSCGCCVVM